MANFNQSPLGQATVGIPQIANLLEAGSTAFGVNASAINFNFTGASGDDISLDPQGALGTAPGMYPIYRRTKRIISSFKES